MLTNKIFERQMNGHKGREKAFIKEIFDKSTITDTEV